MTSIEDIAIHTYQKNINYFKEHQGALFEKLMAFDSAIEQNLYVQKYDLIANDDYFDVLELSSGNYLYSSSSKTYASQASNTVDFKKTSNAFETFKKVDIQEEDLPKYAKLKIADNNLSGFAPILHLVDKNSPKLSTLEKIKKFIFFGVGLGTHLVSIDKKISANVYFIVEDDLELFKLSVFTTPYYELALKAKLIFSVFAEKEEFDRDAANFLNTEFEDNHYLKYFHMLNHSEDKIREFHIKVTSQTHNLFYYSEILKQYIRPLDYLNSGFNFLNLVKLNANSYFDSKPVLLIGAGPSLSKNISWLKKNHKKFIIVALSATLSILEKNGIKPDIVTHIDGLSTASVHFNKLNSLDFLKETLFLLSAKTQREIVDKLNKENVFFFEHGTSYKKDFGNLTAPCVGSTSYLLLLIFNVKELYLLGLDLALDSKTLCTHSDGHEYAQKLDLNSMSEDTLSYGKSIIKTLGNFQEEVFTTPAYKFSIDSINTSSQNFKSDNQNVYNLSDGARFTNTITTDLNTIELKDIDKQTLYSKMHNTFDANSSKQITDDEIQALHAKTKHSLDIKEIILTQKNSSFNSVEEFLNSLTLLSTKLSISHSLVDYDLALVYENYFKFIYTFIFDFFNTRELKKKKLFIEALNLELTKQLLRIETTYENALKSESIESLALQTYKKNIDYFSVHYPELLNKIQAVENANIIQKYDLEYLDGYFDVKELKSGHYLYSGDTKEISKEFAKLVNFKKNSNIFEGFPLYNFSDETLANLDDKSRCLDGIYPIMNYYIEHTKNNDIMKNIKKFIFIGTGLGIHIPLILKKTKAKVCLVIEDDIELFRLSLFTTKYSELSVDTKIYFSVAENENIFLKTMHLFLDNSFIDNRYLKYSYFPTHSKNKIKQIQNALSTQSFVTFPYKTELEKFLRPLEYINNGYSVVNLAKDFKNSVFSTKPLLLVASGPSFKKNLPWLRKNHKKFIIMAVSATLKTLYENSIHPDIVTHLDGFNASMVHYDGFDAKEFLKETTIVMGPFSPSKLREMFSKEKIFYYEENTNYFDGFGSIVAPCIGSFSLLLALKLNAKELFLLGLDLALDQKSGSTHSEGHSYAKDKDMSKKDELNSVISLRENLFPVEGNLEKTVYTTSAYHQSIHSLFASIPNSKAENQSIYNLSDGAKINKTLPKHAHEVNLTIYKDIDKEELQVQIFKTLDKNATKELSSSDVDSLKQRLENSKEIKKHLLYYSNNISYTTSANYLHTLLTLVSKVLINDGRESNNLTHIYYHFFKYSLPIIVDFLNNKNLKNETNHIKELDKMLQKEIYIIEDMYEEALSQFIDNRC
ncbi:MAG: 6-hydroxymethylpterin diphosphokinase MptE-like protein [Campylobacterota bacterium]|nr:6-hydroxymethylpterin diphosphokinase MptE-like protein [Campylobacterota bacterium]